MKIENGSLYSVMRYTKKTDWTDLGILNGEDVKLIIRGWRKMEDFGNTVIYDREGTASMIDVTKVC